MPTPRILLLLSLGTAFVAAGCPAAPVRTECREAINACVAQCSLRQGPDEDGHYHPSGAGSGSRVTATVTTTCERRCAERCGVVSDGPAPPLPAEAPLQPQQPLEADPTNPLLPK